MMVTEIPPTHSYDAIIHRINIDEPLVLKYGITNVSVKEE